MSPQSKSPRQKLSKESDLKDELEEPKGLASSWFIGIKNHDDKEKLVIQLKNNQELWRILKRIINTMFQGKKRGTTDFSKENWYEELIFTEGYKKALQDVYNLIPKGDPK